MEDHCIEQLKIWLGKSDREQALFEWYHTFHSSIAFPLGQRMTIRPEVILVMQKFKLIEQQTHKIAFPVNPFINITYSF
jgi:hypothetical protein